MQYIKGFGRERRTREGSERGTRGPRERGQIPVLGTAAFIAKGNLHFRRIAERSRNRSATGSCRVSIRFDLLIGAKS